MAKYIFSRDIFASEIAKLLEEWQRAILWEALARLSRASLLVRCVFFREWYHPCDTTFAGRGEEGITRMIPLAPGGDSYRNPCAAFCVGVDSNRNPPGYRWAIAREKPVESLLSQSDKFC